MSLRTQSVGIELILRCVAKHPPSIYVRASHASQNVPTAVIRKGTSLRVAKIQTKKISHEPAAMQGK